MWENFVFLVIFDTCDVMYNWFISLLPPIKLMQDVYTSLKLAFRIFVFPLLKIIKDRLTVFNLSILFIRPEDYHINLWELVYTIWLDMYCWFVLLVNSCYFTNFKYTASMYKHSFLVLAIVCFESLRSN